MQKGTKQERQAAWTEFIKRIEMRMKQGERVYGETSFNRPLVDLGGEIREELEDVCGWSFIMWCRLRDMELRMTDRQKAAADVPAGETTIENANNLNSHE